MTQPAPAYGTLYDGTGAMLRDATEEEWRKSAKSTYPIGPGMTTPMGVFLSDMGQVQYVQGGPDPSTA